MFSPHADERRPPTVTSGDQSVIKRGQQSNASTSTFPRTTQVAAANGQRPPTASSSPHSDVTPPVSTTTLWLRRADQLLLCGLLISLVMLLAIARWRLSGGGRTEIEITSQRPREYFYAIDINRASWVEWAQLDGIGEKLARRIVLDRDEHGPFKSIADVGRVRGVGPKLIEKLKSFLRCDGEPDQSSPDRP